ncbi:chemotaxis protein CheW, partial [Neptunomonas phycophila]
PLAAPAPGLSVGPELNCVLVNLAGLKLAIPFEYIEGTLSLDTLTLKLENTEEWIIGSFGSSLSYTRIVDAGSWLMPGRYESHASDYAECVILEGRQWAIACDELLKSLRIPVSEVNWNANKESRPWLLGTYMPERCAVVDVRVLLEQFEQAFQN